MQAGALPYACATAFASLGPARLVDNRCDIDMKFTNGLPRNCRMQ